MKGKSLLIIGAVVALGLKGFGQGTIGSATESGIDRFYDDGFVRVDETGNADGYTSFYGYQSEEQLNGYSSIVFHYLTQINAESVLITDTYTFGARVIINDPFPFPTQILTVSEKPISRSFSVVPEPSSFVLTTISYFGLVRARRFTFNPN